MPFSPVMRVESGKLHSADPWVELWQIRINSTQVFYACGHPTAVTFNGITYNPYWIERTNDERDTHGTIPILKVSVGNLDSEVSAFLQAGDLLGQTVVRQLVQLGLTGDVNSYVEDRWKILDAELVEFAVIFRLGLTNPLELPFPRRRIQRNRCDFVYGGTLCGYNISRSGALATCDKTFDGTAGCIAHGDDEAAAGIPRDHPRNFGGEPGLAQGPYV